MSEKRQTYQDRPSTGGLHVFSGNPAAAWVPEFLFLFGKCYRRGERDGSQAATRKPGSFGVDSVARGCRGLFLLLGLVPLC